MKKKTKYEKLVEQYNERQNLGTCCQTPQSSQKNVLSMVFGTIFIFIYLNQIIHGHFGSALINYLVMGVIFAGCAWVQYKYVTPIPAAVLSKWYKNYSFFKLWIAWLPSMFLSKVTNWIYS